MAKTENVIRLEAKLSITPNSESSIQKKSRENQTLFFFVCRISNMRTNQNAN